MLHVNVRKCGGPVGLKGWIFKRCTLQLSSIYAFMFYWSIRDHLVPPIWKTSGLIPVPKKSAVKELNGLRPVALTSIVTKCLEKLIAREIKKCFSVLQDPMQFAYRENRNFEDAILVFLQNVYKHLDTHKNYCRILFVDFSSTFNTIQPHLLISKLHKLDLNPHLTAWIVNFLTARPQCVKLNDNKKGNCSDTVFSNIVTIDTGTYGAPQGAVLSPLLCTIYTNDCTTVNNATTGTHILKFADDTCIQGLIFEEETNYREAIHWFVKWCEEHFLLLNVKKTKEMILDYY